MQRGRSRRVPGSGRRDPRARRTGQPHHHDVRAVRFTDARHGTRGYQRDEVDAFLDLVAAVLRHRR
ncbi:DivIVA domain-containing protein [Nocardia asteroides]